MKYLLSLLRQIKHTYLILTPSSRPVVKLHGFFCCFECKKTSSGAGYIVGETRISNCATDEEKFSNNKFIMDLAKVTKISLHLQR